MTPTTRAEASTSGPPELPGLIGASVWMPSMYAVGASALPDSFTVTGRSTADTIPCVTVPGSPSGEPTATTVAPTRADEESPVSRGRRRSSASTLITARS